MRKRIQAVVILGLFCTLTLISHSRKVIPPCPYTGIFEQTYYRPAMMIEHDYGLDHRIVLGMISVETAYGENILRVKSEGVWTNSNNLFNIKSFGGWEGQRGYALVREYHGTNAYLKRQWFRVYDNKDESFRDFIRLLTDPGKRYINIWHLRHDPERYVSALHDIGYATHPEYSEAILSRIRRLE